MVLETVLIYFTGSCPVFPSQLIAETVFSPLCILVSFVVNALTINAWVCLQVLYPIPLICVFLCQYHAVTLVLVYQEDCCKRVRCGESMLGTVMQRHVRVTHQPLKPIYLDQPLAPLGMYLHGDLDLSIQTGNRVHMLQSTRPALQGLPSVLHVPWLSCSCTPLLMNSSAYSMHLLPTFHTLLLEALYSVQKSSPKGPKEVSLRKSLLGCFTVLFPFPHRGTFK